MNSSFLSRLCAALSTLVLLTFSSGSWSATILVNSALDTVADDGQCTLREAMTAAETDNGSGGMAGECAAGDVSPTFDVIEFNIAGAGPHLIQPTSALPTMTGIVFIDGDTQPGTDCAVGDIRLVLDGSLAGSTANGFSANGFGGVLGVNGFVINNFTLAGIEAVDSGGVEVFCNFIGTNQSGTAASPNGVGILAVNSTGVLIGGPFPIDSNLISGNIGPGVLVSAMGQPRANQSPLPRLRGLIAGIFGNQIGTNLAGTAAIPNAEGVVVQDVADVLIGGPGSGDENLISGNIGAGILLAGQGASMNTGVDGNLIGVNASVTGAIPNDIGLAIAASDDNQIGVVRGNVISGNAMNGVDIFDATGTILVSNVIGTDLTGATPIPNGNSGVFALDAPGTVIGDTTPRAPDALGNDIHFNQFHGVHGIGPTTSLTLDNNRIENNGASGLQLDNEAVVTGSGNCFAQNLEGLVYAGTGSVVAENNWWGHPTGPTGLPGGFGDSVIGNVDADPFLMSPPATCITLTPAQSGFSPTSVDFGMVPVGMPATTVPVTLTNNGTVPMEIFNIMASVARRRGPSDFTVTNQTCPISPMTLAPGANCQFDVDFTPTFQGVVTGNVMVTNNSLAGDEFLPLSGEGVANDADLEITAVDTPDPVGAGQQLVYTLNATNLGPSPAVMADVLLNLPPEATYVSNDCAQPPPQQGGQFLWFVGDLNGPFPETVTCNVTTSIAPFASGPITAVADIASLTGDSNLTNNTVNITTTVQQESDLFVTKTDGQGTYEPGEVLTYTITVGSNGVANASGVLVEDFFGPEFDSVSWTCTPALLGISGCLAGSGTGDISVLVDIIPGSTVTIEATAQVSAGASADPLVNTVTVTPPSGVVDPVPGNNVAMDSNALVGQGADLAVTKTDGQTDYMPGDTLNYVIQVENLGPTDVFGADLQDIFAPQFDTVSWNCSASPGGACSQAGGNGNILLSLDIPVGGIVTINASADVALDASADPLLNSVLVSAPQGITDPDLSNNVASDFNTLSATQVDLFISKTDNADVLNPGDPVIYTIVVGNDGPDTAVDARVSDFFPNTIENVSWNCNAQGGAQCPASGDGNIDHLVRVPSGGSLTYTAQGLVSLDAGGTMTNTASVAPAAGTVDLDPTNNSVTDTTAVAGSVDLVLSKVAGFSPALSGSSLPYILTVTNQGGAAATEVVLVDSLPDAVSFEGAAPDQGSCAHADGTVTCQLGEVDAGATVMVVVSVDLAADASGVLTNSAAVSLNETDANPDNNQVTIQTPIEAELLLLPLEPNLPDATLGEAYQVAFQAVGGTPPVILQGDGDIPGLGFSQVPNMPVLQLSGMPQEPGTFTFTVTATDNAEPSMEVSREYTLQVLGGLQVSPTNLVPAAVGVPYSVIFGSPDGVPPLDFALDAPPPGLELVGDMLAGTPTMAGTFEFGVVVNDSEGNSGSRNYQLMVLDGVDIVENPLPVGSVGLPYQAAVSAIGGAPPLQWSASGLPTGLSMSSGGLISGVPGSIGVSDVSVSVTDNDGAGDSALFELIVAQNALVNLTPPFPNGGVGFSYQSPIVVTGGLAPYQCDILGGALPPGLGLNGCQVSGVPTVAGTFSVDISVTDSATNPAALQFTDEITIINDTIVPGGSPPVLPINPPVDSEVPGTGNGSPGSGFPDEALQVAKVDAFGFRYLAGFSYNGNNYDVRVLKYGPNGDLIWNTALDSGGQDYAYALAINPVDLSIHVAGYRLVGSQYVAVLQRLNTAGELMWEVTNDGGVQVDAFYDVIADRGGVYVTGERFNGENFDVLIAKYANGGALLWENSENRNDTESGYAMALDFCDDSGHACALLVGGQVGRDGDRGWLADYDPGTGARGQMASVDAHSIVDMQLLDDNLVAGGNNAAGTWGISRFGPGLNTQWTTTYNEGNRFRALSIDREGFIYAAGRGDGPGGRDGLIALLAPADGVFQDDYRYDDGGAESFNGIAVTPANNLVVAGQSTSGDSNQFLLLTIDVGKTFE